MKIGYCKGICFTNNPDLKKKEKKNVFFFGVGGGMLVLVICLQRI